MAGHIEFQQTNKINQAIAPQAVAGSLTSTYFDMGEAHHAVAIIEVGAHTTDVVVLLNQGIAAGVGGGGTVKAIAGKTVTVVVGMANSFQVIECEASELDVNGGFKSIAVLTTVAAGAGALISVTFIRTPLRREPSSLVT